MDNKLHLIASRIKEVRNDLKMSQQKFADSLGVSKPFISMCENGKKEPSKETAAKIAKLGNVSVSYILADSDQKELDLELSQLMEQIKDMDEGKRKMLMGMIKGAVHDISDR